MTSKTPRKNSTKLQHLSEVFQKKLKKDSGDPKHKENQSIRKKDLFPERFQIPKMCDKRLPVYIVLIIDIGEQEFRLKWNNNQPTLIAVLDRLLVNQTLVDITLAAEGQTLKAHKLVLSACSPFFHDLLSNYTGRDMVVFLKDVRFVELQALIDYMYKGEVSIAQHNLASLIQTAESLKIKGLAEPDDLSRRAPPPPPPPLHKINIVSSQSPKSEYKKVSADYPVGVPNFGSVCMKRRRVDVPDSSVSEVDKEKEVVGVNGSDELNSSKPKLETSFSEDEGAEDEWSENEISNTQEGEDSQDNISLWFI